MSLPRLIGFLFVLMATQASTKAADINFVSPSGNIQCHMNQFAAACVIADFTPSFTSRPDSCAGDWGNYFYVIAGKSGRLGCVTGEFSRPTFTLEYGNSVTADRITCTSRTSGMTCSTLGGGGFSLRRATQSIF